MKKILSSMLAMLVISLSLPHVAWADAPTNGTCGEDVVWELTTNADDSTMYDLTIKPAAGTTGGYMYDVNTNEDTPWYGSRDSIKSIVIEYGVNSIGDFAITKSTSLESVTIPDSVDSIGVLAFAGCTRLKSVTIPDSVTFIDTSAFNGCTSLTAIDVDQYNDTYQSIDGVVFSKDGYDLLLCPKGKSGEYIIPDNVKTIGYQAFVYCQKLTSVTIPDSVDSIGYRAFGGCSGLTSITIPDSVTSIDDSAFEDCTRLKSVTIPASVTLIDRSAFNGCTSLEFVTIPKSVNTIGDFAFYGCTSLTSVTIPDSVKSIGNVAFSGCTSLTTVKIPCNFDKSIFKKDSSGINPQEDDNNKYTVSGTSTSGDFEYVHSYGTGTVTTSATYLADGIRTYTCQDCGEQKAETIPKLTHDDPTAGVQYWGTREVHNGHEMYVDDEGKTSALVTGNEKIWLREESYDPVAGQNLAAWYMLDNTSGEFEAGSRFSVQWLNNKDNPTEFLKHFNNIDQTTRDRVDSNRLWIFSVGVTKPDGTTEYKTLSQEIPLYIQMGTDWDYSDIKAMYISDSEDEEVYASYLNMEYPGGKGEFAKLGLKHFSPYAIYDYLTDEEKAETESSSSNQVKTGDETGYILLISSSTLIIAGLYLELCMKKKRN